LEAIRGIEQAVKGKSYRDYQRSWILRSAAERGIEESDFGRVAMIGVQFGVGGIATELSHAVGEQIFERRRQATEQSG